MLESKQAVLKIANLKEQDIGGTEENVKQKFIVPLLELLGHKKEDLQFEYRTRTGKIDIYIKNVAPDCRVIIDTKNYGEPLNEWIEQIKQYTYDESALLALIANGTEIRIYSPLRGIAFENSLLYIIKRDELAEESVWSILEGLLHFDNLRNGNTLKKVNIFYSVFKMLIWDSPPEIPLEKGGFIIRFNCILLSV